MLNLFLLKLPIFIFSANSEYGRKNILSLPAIS